MESGGLNFENDNCLLREAESVTAAMNASCGFSRSWLKTQNDVPFFFPATSVTVPAPVSDFNGDFVCFWILGYQSYGPKL